MTYTFFHSGIAMGQSDLASKFRHARQRGGLFLPTAYRRTLLPRVTGVLAAGRALRTDLASLGRSVETLRRSPGRRLEGRRWETVSTERRASLG